MYFGLIPGGGGEERRERGGRRREERGEEGEGTFQPIACTKSSNLVDPSAISKRTSGLKCVKVGGT